MIIDAFVDGLSGKHLNTVPVHLLFVVLSTPLLNHVVFRRIQTRSRRLGLKPVHPAQIVLVELHLKNILE